MALHFAPEEYASRLSRLKEEMAARKLDALLIFSQESMYWLTGYDGFGYVFFQCLVVTKEGRLSLVSRAADHRQARRTSVIEENVVWTDRAGADPTRALKDHLFELDLLGANIGVEIATYGLTAKNGRLLEEQLRSFAKLHEASEIIPNLRAVKSVAEINYVRKAARLARRGLARRARGDPLRCRRERHPVGDAGRGACRRRPTIRRTPSSSARVPTRFSCAPSRAAAS